MNILKNKNALFIIASAAACALLMCLADGVFKLPYALKSCVKICLFLVVPMCYLFFNKKGRDSVRSLFVPSKRSVLLALALGVGVFSVILGAYFLLSSVIDFSAITESLTSGAGVGKDNFVYVALYISFVNSLLEEFFFRGYSFLLLKKETSRSFAYIFSSACFALYHAGMTSGWFNAGIYLLSVVGLFAGGCIFNYLNEKSECIYPSYLTHMFANFAINFIGFIMFGII